eukprot:Plantae.Rhodophyta-Rhodochaete_pulchella.ctg1729.p1 GENE.Plantae.Rhodophyta-Rhodochaete_pulchella.ctg1729~~Plantae.Rhodophyta-Rhodochaete_pulchella.ctg1729.p1  ORF type:complete len:153 (-),score=22.88 Plantae.Rhodophyta-Rhodochaete_pulchella.ctg1729:219-677(-)
MTTVACRWACDSRDPFSMPYLLSGFEPGLSVYCRQRPSYESWVDSDGTVQLELEMPGLRREDVSVELKDEMTLEIAGNRRREQSIEDKDRQLGEGGRQREERDEGYHKFERSFRLPRHADLGAIQAKLSVGLMHISIPKRQVDATNRKVLVQ